MEEKLLDEFQLYCKFNCKYKKNEEVIESLVYNDYEPTYTIPCNYCQIREFIREVGDRL